jgi:DNA-binding NtrC family response regulator
MCRGDVIDYVGEPASTAGDGAACPLVRFQLAKAEALRNFERSYVTAALRQAGGNVTRAAQMSGTERRAFGKLLKKHGIDRSTDAGAAALR